MTTQPSSAQRRSSDNRDTKNISAPPPRKRRNWLWLAIGCPAGCLVFVVVAGLIFSMAGGLIFSSFGSSTQRGQGGTPLSSQNTAQSAEQVATHFLNSLEKGSYEEAYGDLEDSVALTLSQPDFVQAAKTDDHCDGAITGYQEISKKDSGTITYQVTRKHFHSYQIVLTLQDDGGVWFITGFSSGNQSLSLVPVPPTCN